MRSNRSEHHPLQTDDGLANSGNVVTIGAATNPSAAELPQVIRKRSIRVAGHATSVSLEQTFWDELRTIAADQGRSMNAVISDIDRNRGTNLSSAIRVFVLKSVRSSWLQSQKERADA